MVATGDDRASQMNIPIFPLQSVLFPGIPLRLHIFEPRYKLLVQKCLAAGSPFGVALIAEGQEALGPLPTPHEVGCTARINYLEPLGDGRSNLLAVGHRRFRILQVQQNRPYLTADIEVLRYPERANFDAAQQASSTRILLEQYLGTLGRLGQWQGEELNTPDDPIAMAHLACGALQIPSVEKQQLLAIGDLHRLFARIERLLRRELALLDQLAARGLERLETTSSLN